MHKNSTAGISALARVSAVVLAALFVVTALASLILFDLDRRAFDPAVYKQALAANNFYGQFPTLLGDLLVKNTNGDTPSIFGILTTDQWKYLIQAVLPEQQLRSMTEDTIDQFFSYLNGEISTPQISLVPLKNTLLGPAGLNEALKFIRSQPDCTILDIPRILNSFADGFCNPPGEVLAMLQPVIQEQLQTAVALVPDDIPLLSPSASASLEPQIKALKIFRIFMRLSLLLPIILLLGLSLVAVRSVKGWLGWWGAPFFITGVFGVILGFTAPPILRWFIERWLSKRLTITFTPELSASIRGVVESSFREILKPVSLESLALLVVGLVMILLSAVITSRQK